MNKKCLKNIISFKRNARPNLDSCTGPIFKTKKKLPRTHFFLIIVGESRPKSDGTVNPVISGFSVQKKTAKSFGTPYHFTFNIFDLQKTFFVGPLVTIRYLGMAFFQNTKYRGQVILLILNARLNAFLAAF